MSRSYNVPIMSDSARFLRNFRDGHCGGYVKIAYSVSWNSYVSEFIAFPEPTACTLVSFGIPHYSVAAAFA